MASIILRSVGAAAGNALLPGVGGVLFGALGRSFGGIIDGQLGLGGQVTGPRLENLSVQDSRYGAGISIIYGRARAAGNVIWSSDLIESRHDSQFAGGKGALSGSSTTTTTYTYSVHCAVGICAGPIGGIVTVWADSTVIFQDGVWLPGILDSASVYTGTASQPPDPFMQSLLGGDAVPAYRGLAYIVFENLQLASFGNRLPNLTFEILPVTSTVAPVLTGTVNPGISQRDLSIQNGGMIPIVLDGGSTEARQILVGGYIATGTSYVFETLCYDVTGDTPVELYRTSSASFTSGASVSDTSWALAPDGRFVAMYFKASSVATHYFCLYDIDLRQFGAPVAVALDVTTAYRAIGWLDATHFAVTAINGTSRGMHSFVRAGTGIVDLGFTDVWGPGSAAHYIPMFYAQFTPCAGGLLHYIWDASVGTALTIYVRTLVWQNNRLVVGAAYPLAAGLATGGASGAHIIMIRTGGGEWTLLYGTVGDYHLLSFEPSSTGATITRPWQGFTLPGVGTTNYPVYYGDRLVILQGSAIASSYSLSEVLLGSGSFTLGTNFITVGGLPAGATTFAAMRIDSGRMLALAGGGFVYAVDQVAILQRVPTGGTLQAIVADLLTRAGYISGDYDLSALAGITVDGYMLTDPTCARAAIEPLQVFYPFDLIESAGQLKAVPRSTAVAALITAAEWRAINDQQPPPPALAESRAQELDLPLEINVDYLDASRDFEVNSQRARRIVTRATAVQKISLPVVCTASIAKQIAETRLYTLWNERIVVKLALSRRWLVLDPGDVVDLGNGSLLRVTAIDQTGGLLRIEGFYVYTPAQTSAAVADIGATTDHPDLTAPASTLYLMDMPLLQAADDQPGIYVAATGISGWKSASIWRAADGVNYSQLGAVTVAATAGIATTALPISSGCYLDNASTVTVQLTNGTLSGCADADLYNGANAALLGGEIIQFGIATLIGPGLYSLSRLLRGRRATEAMTANHTVGENFILLTSGAVDFLPALLADRNRSYDFRALTTGQSLGDAPDNLTTYGLATLAPFAPVNIQATRAAGIGTDLTLIWKRRARLHADWVDYIDVPLDEPAELYDVDIMNGTTAIRTFAANTAPTVTYTAAQQAADWPSGVPAAFTVNIYQISSRYGRGNAASATI